MYCWMTVGRLRWDVSVLIWFDHYWTYYQYSFVYMQIQRKETFEGKLANQTFFWGGDHQSLAAWKAEIWIAKLFEWFSISLFSSLCSLELPKTSAVQRPRGTWQKPWVSVVVAIAMAYFTRLLQKSWWILGTKVRQTGFFSRKQAYVENENQTVFFWFGTWPSVSVFRLEQSIMLMEHTSHFIGIYIPGNNISVSPHRYGNLELNTFSCSVKAFCLVRWKRLK